MGPNLSIGPLLNGNEDIGHQALGDHIKAAQENYLITVD